MSARSVVAALVLLAGPGLTAAAAGRGRDERRDRQLPGARDYDGGDLHGHRRQRLVETSGQRAVGGTSAEWKLTSGDVDVRAVPRVFPSLTVMLHLVVMLPGHETPDDLPAVLRGRWERSSPESPPTSSVTLNRIRFPWTFHGSERDLIRTVFGRGYQFTGMSVFPARASPPHLGRQIALRADVRVDRPESELK